MPKHENLNCEVQQIEEEKNKRAALTRYIEEGHTRSVSKFDFLACFRLDPSLLGPSPVKEETTFLPKKPELDTVVTIMTACIQGSLMWSNTISLPSVGLIAMKPYLRRTSGAPYPFTTVPFDNLEACSLFGMRVILDETISWPGWTIKYSRPEIRKVYNKRPL